jgi:hypothetical protein
MTAPKTAPRDVHAKALAINLDPSKYGSIAEIGAGQEVARWFLRSGGASGTVARTISAYDKVVSDQTYGAGTRYVSKERLQAMLTFEYTLLTKELGAVRGANTRFFAFADTVSARNFLGTNEQHGWIGIRFQTEPGSESSDVLLHVNLMDHTNQQQQEAVGKLGVNLVYAAFHERASSEEFLRGLYEELTIENLEIDVLELAGPAFEEFDQRLWSLEMLGLGMTPVIAFDAEAKLAEPSSVLRKRPLVVHRGSIATAEPYHKQALEASERQLRLEEKELSREPASVVEITTRSATGTTGELDLASLLARVEGVAHFGGVLVSVYPETYRLVEYLRRHTDEPIRLVAGVSTFARILEESFYQNLPGSILEGFGRLLATNVKVHVSPMSRDLFIQILGGIPEGLTLGETTKGMVTADDLLFLPPNGHLYNYARAAGRIVPLLVPPELVEADEGVSDLPSPDLS